MMAGAMLWVTWKLLQKVDIGDMDGKLMAFGLIALNPNLVRQTFRRRMTLS